MNDKHNVKFGIKVDKFSKGWWSFGSAISHSPLGELYLYINLCKCAITIGWIYKEAN